jgi:hypothetical protein
MATRAQELVSRAVERARLRIPGFAPDSVQVVELARDQTFVVVRTRPAGVVVLDRAGRLVKGRDRLSVIGRHLRSLTLLEGVLEEARLAQRREHAERSIAFLGQAVASPRGRRARAGVTAVVAALEALVRAIDIVAAQADRRRELPPTERTLRRIVMLHNEAAAADREVVRAARRLAAQLALKHPTESVRPVDDKLHRWVVARLAAVDLPYLLPELEEEETARFVESFVVAARTEVVSAAE